MDPADVTPERAAGLILCQDVVSAGEVGRSRLPKGHVVQAGDIPALRAFSGELHLVRMESGDVHEDEASLRLARAICGEGLRLHGPIESQTHLRAAHRGVVRVRSAALDAMNALPD